MVSSRRVPQTVGCTGPRVAVRWVDLGGTGLQNSPESGSLRGMADSAEKLSPEAEALLEGFRRLSASEQHRLALRISKLARQATDEGWLAYARGEAARGFAALDRGEGISATVEEHMAAIDALTAES